MISDTMVVLWGLVPLPWELAGMFIVPSPWELAGLVIIPSPWARAGLFMDAAGRCSMDAAVRFMDADGGAMLTVVTLELKMSTLVMHAMMDGDDMHAMMDGDDDADDGWR